MLRLLVVKIKPTSNEVGSAFTQKCITGLCWSLLGLHCSKKVAKDFLILQNPTANHPKHSRL